MTNDEHEEVLKDNIIALVKEHKANCNSSDCGISTYLVKQLVDKAGIKLTQAEIGVFT